MMHSYAGCKNSDLAGHGDDLFPKRRKELASMLRFVSCSWRNGTLSLHRSQKKSDRLWRQGDYVPGFMMELRIRYWSQDRVRWWRWSRRQRQVHGSSSSHSPAPGVRCKQGFIRDSSRQKRHLSTVSLDLFIFRPWISGYTNFNG